MKKYLNNNLIIYFVIFLIIIFGYWNLPNGFFEQDEWHSFGNYILLQSLSIIDFIKTVLINGPFTHFTPLSLLTKMTFFNFFKLNANFYFLISLFFHFLISIQVFVLITNLTKSKLKAFIGLLFFAVNASHFQAVTWLGTFEGVELSTFFGLLALNKYLTNQNKIQIAFCILISLLFKEIGFIFFGLIVFLMLYEKEKLKNTLQIIYALGIYLILKFSYLLFNLPSKPAVIANNLNDFGNIIIYNGVSLFPKLLSISLFSNNLIKKTSNFIFPYLEPFLPDLNNIWVVYSDMIYDLVAFVAGLFLFIIITLFLYKKHKKEYLLSILFVIFSAVLLIPLKKYLIYPDSRYFYTVTIGISIIIASLSKKISIVFWALLLTVNVIYLKIEVNGQVQLGIIRKNILRETNAFLPQLSNNTIIYTESNKSYFGFDRTILPFQNGLGEILLVNYSLKQKIPIEFIKNDNFWDINYQGYENYNNFGFGYYYNLDNLKERILKDNISLNNVYSFSFVSPDNHLYNISDQIKNEIGNKSLNKFKINLAGVVITPSINSENTKLLFDDNLNTFWDTKLPYKYPQDLYLDLGVKRKVVQIELNSYTNKDQNNLGFMILTSENNKDWVQVFRDDLRPPDKFGKVNIYLQSIPIRYIRIKQIGYHDFAPWVVHELQLYEAKN